MGAEVGHEALVAGDRASVVIPTHNRAEVLGQALEPLLADPLVGELVVVLDGCTDPSPAVVAEASRRDPRVHAVSTEGVGPALARQAGVERARGEIVVMLDDDVIAGDGLIAGHLRHHALRRGLVVVGYCRTALPPPPGPDDSAIYLYALDYERVCRRYERDPSSVLRHLCGGNLSMRTADCLAVGWHSDRFGEWVHEDRDFGLRCMREGLVGVFDRSLEGRHEVRRSLDDLLRRTRSQVAGMSLVDELHHDVLGALPEGRSGGRHRRAVHALLRAAARPRLYRITQATLRAALRAASGRGLLPVRVAITRALRRLELENAARARRSPAAP